MEINILTNSIFNTTPEGVAAEKLRDMLSASIPDEVEGQIKIAPQISLPIEHVVRDIDLVVWGEFSNFKLPNYYSEREKESKKDLQVKDFFIVVEIKGHPIDSLSIQGEYLFADYSAVMKDVTLQSENQRYSMMDYLKSNDINIYVSSAIWLRSITKEEIQSLNIVALPDDFIFKDIVDAVIIQGMKPAYDKTHDCYVLSAGINSKELESCLMKSYQ